MEAIKNASHRRREAGETRGLGIALQPYLMLLRKSDKSLNLLSIVPDVIKEDAAILNLTVVLLSKAYHQHEFSRNQDIHRKLVEVAV